MSLEAFARRTWSAPTPEARTLRAALVPASLAYRGAMAVRNRLYDAGWLRVTRVPARVVCVGNLAVGGTGKTPTALWLAERLAARGRRVAIVARGYRKTRPGVVVVGVDGRALVEPEEGGDEAVMLARRFRGPVVTAERRADAAELASRELGCDTIVLDDGFQHRALARDVDLVVLGPGDERAWCLPAGPLREPPAALHRAQAVLDLGDGDAAAAGPPRFHGRVVAGGFTGPGASRAGGEVAAVAGIGRPERFVDALARAGTTVGARLFFPDHHRYDAADVARIRAVAAGRPVVTTEKDLPKLERFPELAPLAALTVHLEVDRPDALLALVEA